MARFREPVYPVSNVGCFYDEPVLNFYETGFSELEEVLSRFQAGSSSGPDVNRAVLLVDERKQRRMVSNRESARRSRWRKKAHLQSITTEFKRLKEQNREFKKRFSTALCANQLVRKENYRLKAESLVLWARFSNLSQILLARQLMLNPMTVLLT